MDEQIIDLLQEIVAETKRNGAMLSAILNKRSAAGRNSELALEVQKERIETRKARMELEAKVEERRRGNIQAKSIGEEKPKTGEMTADDLAEMLEDE